MLELVVKLVILKIKKNQCSFFDYFYSRPVKLFQIY
jgi:hypothetical protein